MTDALTALAINWITSDLRKKTQAKKPKKT